MVESSNGEITNETDVPPNGWMSVFMYENPIEWGMCVCVYVLVRMQSRINWIHIGIYTQLESVLGCGNSPNIFFQ